MMTSTPTIRFWMVLLGAWAMISLTAPNTSNAQDASAAEETPAAAEVSEEPVPAEDATPRQATVAKVGGQHVQVSMDGQSWQKAAVGQELGQDALVRTGFASRCELAFGEHTVVNVEALSSVKIADYLADDQGEHVQAHVQYGAVRCGVEKGRVKANTQITTPVSTLAIRGTRVKVEYDPGTRRCELAVDRDGPAIVRTDMFGRMARLRQMRGQRQGGSKGSSPQGGGQKGYVLAEGMKTNETSKRYLELAQFERTFWVTGDVRIGEISGVEGDAIARRVSGASLEPTEGGLQFNTEIQRNRQDIPPRFRDLILGDDDGVCYDCWQSF